MKQKIKIVTGASGILIIIITFMIGMIILEADNISGINLDLIKHVLFNTLISMVITLLFIIGVYLTVKGFTR